MLCFSSLCLLIFFIFFNFFFLFFVTLKSCFKERLHAVIGDLAGLLNREAGWEEDSIGREEKGSDSQSRSVTQSAPAL